MKKISIFVTLFLLSNSALMYAQTLTNTAELTPSQKEAIFKGKHKAQHPSSANNATTKGLHFEFEGAYAPFGTWEVECSKIPTSENALEGMEPSKTFVKTKHTVGANLAAVYQFENIVYLGGGIGVREVALEYKDEEGYGVSNSYAIPVFIRAGIFDAISEKLSFYLNLDVALQGALDRSQKKVAVLPALGVGLCYGNAKLGLTMMSSRPNSEHYIPEVRNIGGNGIDIGVGLLLGVRF